MDDTPMRAFRRSLARVIHVLLISGSAAAFGGGEITINVNNNTTKDLVVTVYDLNTHPAQQVVAGATVNGYASISVAITADDSGRGHVSWTARTVGPDMRMCGHHDNPHLNNSDTVNVYADSACARH
jgi:hypothetical protein